MPSRTYASSLLVAGGCLVLLLALPVAAQEVVPPGTEPADLGNLMEQLIDQLQEQLKTEQYRHEQTRKKAEELNKRLTYLADQHEEARRLIQQHEQHNAELRKMLDERQTTLEKRYGTIEKISGSAVNQIEKLSAALEKEKANHAELKAAYAETKQRADGYAAAMVRAEELTAALQQKQSAHKKIEEECKRLQKKAAEFALALERTDRLAGDLEKKDADYARLEQEHKRLQDQVALLEGEAKRLKTNLAAPGRDDKKFDELRVMMGDLERANQALQERTASLQDQVKDEKDRRAAADDLAADQEKLLKRLIRKYNIVSADLEGIAEAPPAAPPAVPPAAPPAVDPERERQLAELLKSFEDLKQRYNAAATNAATIRSELITEVQKLHAAPPE